jgi:hypothetical protein
MEASTDAVPSGRRHPAGDPLERSRAMHILLAGAPGVIGRQAVPVLSADLDTH